MLTQPEAGRSLFVYTFQSESASTGTIWIRLGTWPTEKGSGTAPVYISFDFAYGVQRTAPDTPAFLTRFCGDLRKIKKFLVELCNNLDAICVYVYEGESASVRSDKLVKEAKVRWKPERFI